MPGQFLPIIIVFIVIGLPVICGTIISLAKMNREAASKSPSAEEAALLQDMHLCLERLERRIEALETIVTRRRTAPPPIREP